MNNMMKLIFTIAITMAIAISTLTTVANMNRGEVEDVLPVEVNDDEVTFSSTEEALPDEEETVYPTNRVSRFLAEVKNPRASPSASFHCNKDNDVCSMEGSPGSTCCNNKCMDLSMDRHNCGACKKKCKYTQSCCRGECVDLAFDKRHCGECGHKCTGGGFCLYGMCDYA